VVLVNLNDARSGAKDASAIASMSSLRAQIELETPDGNYSTACTVAGADLIAAAEDQTATTADCHDTATAWGAELELASGDFFCVDSTGYAGRLATSTALADDEGCLD
jgi:hypothetical protein